MLCGDLNGKEIQKKNIYIYMYNWITLLYTQNQHIVYQLYFNKN